MFSGEKNRLNRQRFGNMAERPDFAMAGMNAIEHGQDHHGKQHSHHNNHHHHVRHMDRLRKTLWMLLAVMLLLGGAAWIVMTNALSTNVGPTTTNMMSLSADHQQVFGLRGGKFSATPMSVFNMKVAKNMENLIIVAGHSITVQDQSLDGVDSQDNLWMLLDYQQNSGMPEAFVRHIRKGVELALKDPKALLVFSGGQTRIDAGPVSEAASYFRVADHFKWWNEQNAMDNKGVRARTVLEEYATDSFQNVLFSLCRFREVTGSYPAQVTVVSFSFKKDRFMNIHRSALRFPVDAFNFVGEDPVSTEFQDRVTQFESWESKASVKPFKDDPYGCNSAILKAKRLERNPFLRTDPYKMTCPEMSQLLSYCKKKPFPAGHLPWDKIERNSKHTPEDHGR